MNTDEDATIQRIEAVGYAAGWDAAVDEACKKVMVLQDGFRKLTKSKREEYQTAVNTKSPNVYRDDIDTLSHEISQGEALVGTLGDAIRNIAALKGHAP